MRALVRVLFVRATTPSDAVSAQEHYEASLELRTGLEVAEGDVEAEKLKQQSIAQSLVSLGNLFAERAETAPKEADSNHPDSRKSLQEQALANLSAAREAYEAGFSEFHPKLAAPWEVRQPNPDTIAPPSLTLTIG